MNRRESSLNPVESNASSARIHWAKKAPSIALFYFEERKSDCGESAAIVRRQAETAGDADWADNAGGPRRALGGIEAGKKMTNEAPAVAKDCKTCK